MGEAEFLREQSDHAKAAMNGVLRDARSDIFRVIDPRLWAKSHPWKTVAAAVIVGFMAGDHIASSASAETSSEVPKSAAEAEPRKPRLSAGRIIVKFIRRAKSIIAFIEPFLQELWMSQMAPTQGDDHTGEEKAAQSPAPQPSAEPHRP